MPELAIRRKYLDTSDINCTVMIALCFLVTSTGWLSWEYHLLDQITAGATDVCTMVIGYLLQAAGFVDYPYDPYGAGGPEPGRRPDDPVRAYDESGVRNDRGLLPA